MKLLNKAERAVAQIESGGFQKAQDGLARASAKIEAFGFDVKSHDKRPHFEAFTTRIDTIFGMTFCVLAPEHAVVDQIRATTLPDYQRAIDEYREQAKQLSDTARASTDREKAGVFTGAYAVN